MSSEFVEVWEGLWNGITPVAVKTLRPQQSITVKDFLQTANPMKKTCHRNIVQLCAVCTKKEPIYIITEQMKHGSLRDYLHGKGNSAKFPQLVDMASQVAAGMAYLEEQNIIHRDLAVRNILVGENLICKVGNFEMAQMIDGDTYISTIINKKIAVKWIAPEVAMYDRFSIKSDVWLFGVVLNEIITHGHLPYPSMSNVQALKQIVEGYHMPQPGGCPNQLYNIMQHCWREEPANRPRFGILQWQIEELEDGGHYSYLA